MAKQRGRPPAGPKGQARASMRQISARLPDETCAQLKALSVVLQTSQADVIARAISALEQALSETDQRLATLLRKRDT
jgi:hypothetical protein